LRKLPIKRANQVWALITTYISLGPRLCLPHSRCEHSHSPGVDAQSDDHAGGVSSQGIIEEASARYGTLDIVNADQGSQFTATEFTEAALPGLQAIH